VKEIEWIIISCSCLLCSESLFREEIWEICGIELTCVNFFLLVVRTPGERFGSWEVCNFEVEIIILVSFLVRFAVMGSEAAAVKELSVVNGVDLERYQGRWYEIASVPSKSQPKSGTNSRATYTLKADKSSVEVLNETWVNGKRSFIHGSAWKVDPSSPDAKLKVRFLVPPFLPVIPVTGDYWVMALDLQDYRWALVGQPSRKCLWILSRTTELSDDVYKELVEQAKNEGYDVSKIHRTTHVEGIGGEDTDDKSTPSDRVGLWWLKSLVGK
jgi:apolipoprotein D and lipocalin family protein